MDDRERMIKGLFNRLNQMKDDLKYYSSVQDYDQISGINRRIVLVKKRLKKLMNGCSHVS